MSHRLKPVESPLSLSRSTSVGRGVRAAVKRVVGGDPRCMCDRVGSSALQTGYCRFSCDIYIRLQQDRFMVQGWLLKNERVDQVVVPAAFRVFRLNGGVAGL